MLSEIMETSLICNGDVWGPAQTLLEGVSSAQTMSSQAAYAVLVELCQHSSTASAGLQALAAGAKGAEQSLVPRMQARPACMMHTIAALLLRSVHSHWTVSACLAVTGQSLRELLLFCRRYYARRSLHAMSSCGTSGPSSL